MAIQGHATAEGTRRYRDRFQNQTNPAHFRERAGLFFSSIGLGTYLGHFDEETDRLYEEAVLEALRLGCNVFDTAINYRCMRSERSLGKALARAFREGFQRDEVIVSTKGGFVPFDGAPPGDPSEYFFQSFVDTGLCKPEDLVAGCHCMTAQYLRNQIERSRENLGLSTLDIYFLHNPETQLGEVERDEFLNRIQSAFEVLEEAVAAGRIKLYGTATWNGYRVERANREHLPLPVLTRIARDVGGEDHHFRVIQLPYNLGMTEALTLWNQEVAEDRKVPVLEIALQQGMVVMTSASIYQGQLARGLPEFAGRGLQGLQTDAQRAIQFVRSTPGVTTALVGMKNPAHLRENLRLARVSPAMRDEFMGLFQGEAK